MNKADYMKQYRKTHPDYVENERVRKKLNIKRWNKNAEDKIKEKEQYKVINWIYNYWRNLKSEGITEKQFINKFGNYLSSLVERNVVYEKE